MSEHASAVRAAIELCFANPHDESHLRSFDELFRPLVLATLVALYRKDPAFAEDAYQSALIKYIQIFRGGKKDGVAYDAYFVAIAKNALLDELRKTKKQAPLDEVLELASYPQSSGLGTAEAGIAFFEVLAKLDRRCQFLIEGFYINGMSYADLAKRLKIQAQSIPVLLSRCREALIGRLKK